MPRISRNCIKSSFLHVMTQGIGKSYIFEKKEDIKYYIKLMYELQQEYNLSIIAYCIMNNHAHILIKTDRIDELSKFMQRLDLKYGIYYNKKYTRVGFVFRNRYKSEEIYGEDHLYNCIKYIYDNPVKAGICKNAWEYPYSNYKKINVKTKMQYSFIETDEDMQTEINRIIDEFCFENDIEKDEIKKYDEELKKLVTLLKEKYKKSLREISRELNVGREKIRKTYKN